jgi:hypothetical protein
MLACIMLTQVTRNHCLEERENDETTTSKIDNKPDDRTQEHLQPEECVGNHVNMFFAIK